MLRKTPLKRKYSLRDSYARKCRESGMPKPKPRAELKRVSSKQLKRLQEYRPIAREWLARPENSLCQICIARGIRPPNASTEVHHKRGRSPKLLCDTRFFVASCFPCRLWPHTNGKEARALGLLAEASEWMVSPAENILKKD